MIALWIGPVRASCPPRAGRPDTLPSAATPALGIVGHVDHPHVRR